MSSHCCCELLVTSNIQSSFIVLVFSLHQSLTNYHCDIWVSKLGSWLYKYSLSVLYLSHASATTCCMSEKSYRIIVCIFSCIVPFFCFVCCLFCICLFSLLNCVAYIQSLTTYIRTLGHYNEEKHKETTWFQFYLAALVALCFAHVRMTWSFGQWQLIV